MTETTYPDIIIPYEASFTSPIDKVWACIQDYGGWGKWFSPLADMKIVGDGLDKIGATRISKSSVSGITYEEVQLIKDQTEHIVEYGVVSLTPPVPCMKYQVIRAQLIPAGENATTLVGTAILTPSCHVPEEMVAKYKAIVPASYKKVYSSLEEYLVAQKEQQQIFSDVLIPSQASFTNPIDKVWACIEDSGSLGKCLPSLAEMKLIGDGVDKVTVKSVAAGIPFILLGMYLFKKEQRSLIWLALICFVALFFI